MRILRHRIAQLRQGIADLQIGEGSTVNHRFIEIVRLCSAFLPQPYFFLTYIGINICILCQYAANIDLHVLAKDIALYGSNTDQIMIDRVGFKNCARSHFFAIGGFFIYLKIAHFAVPTHTVGRIFRSRQGNIRNRFVQSRLGRNFTVQPHLGDQFFFFFHIRLAEDPIPIVHSAIRPALKLFRNAVDQQLSIIGHRIAVFAVHQDI